MVKSSWSMEGDWIRKMEHDLIETKPNMKTRQELRQKGYRLLERTIDVQLMPNGYKPPVKRRFMIDKHEGVSNIDEMISICEEVFPDDYRFHRTEVAPDPEATSNMKSFIVRLAKKEGTISLFANHRDALIAFLILTPENSDLYESTVAEKPGLSDFMRISLAAVKPRYQGTGLAQELYGRALEVAQELGINKVIGRISSINTDVMNLYAYLGGKFTNPVDIYVKP